MLIRQTVIDTLYLALHTYLYKLYMLHQQARGPGLKHDYGALIVHEGRLILLGGDSADIEEYDTEQDSWKTLPYKLPSKLRFHYAFNMEIPK